MKKIEGLGSLRKLAIALALALIFSVLAVSVAQAQQPPQPLTVTKIKDNLYWARGGAGSNDGIIVGKDGVILVDTKTTPDSEKEVLAEVAKITPKMITTVIITHSDGDHVNGLAALPAGLTIIAQENCKKEMEASASSRNPAPQDRLPTKTYDKTDKMTIDGVKIQLYHWAPGTHQRRHGRVFARGQGGVRWRFAGDQPSRHRHSHGKDTARRQAGSKTPRAC